MASNIKALPEKNMRGAPENRDMPLPLLDLSDASVKELIRSAKKRGYVTVDQINSVLPSKEANPVCKSRKSCAKAEFAALARRRRGRGSRCANALAPSRNSRA
jgi:hypothetical protein